MFEEYLAWLQSLTPAQKKELIDNFNNFNRLRACLVAKKFLHTDPKNNNFVLTGDCPQAGEFVELAAKMNLRGVVVRDERPK